MEEAYNEEGKTRNTEKKDELCFTQPSMSTGGVFIDGISHRLTILNFDYCIKI